MGKKNTLNSGEQLYSNAPLQNAELTSSDEKNAGPAPDDKKKKGLFGFGKKEDANVRNVIITYPRSYEDVSGIIDSLRSRQAIIVDFRRVAAKDTQRVLDFLSGALYALGGSQERIGDGMFLFTPEGVTIQGPLSLKRRYD